jgi:hypothetical protein
MVDYASKGLKANRLPDDENLLILPENLLEIAKRPYLGKLSVSCPFDSPSAPMRLGPPIKRHWLM